jgi:hypothetical protein
MVTHAAGYHLTPGVCCLVCVCQHIDCIADSSSTVSKQGQVCVCGGGGRRKGGMVGVVCRHKDCLELGDGGGDAAGCHHTPGTRVEVRGRRRWTVRREYGVAGSKCVLVVGGRGESWNVCIR